MWQSTLIRCQRSLSSPASRCAVLGRGGPWWIRFGSKCWVWGLWSRWECPLWWCSQLCLWSYLRLAGGLRGWGSWSPHRSWIRGCWPWWHLRRSFRSCFAMLGSECDKLPVLLLCLIIEYQTNSVSKWWSCRFGNLLSPLHKLSDHLPSLSLRFRLQSTHNKWCSTILEYLALNSSKRL